jgi:TonB family protein
MNTTTLSICFLLLALYSSAQSVDDTNFRLLEAPPVPLDLADTAKVFTVVEQMPQYAGGDDGLMKFIAANVHYPDSAREHDIQGKVYASFVVNTDGETVEHKIVRGFDPYLNEEALRVVRLLKFEKPSYQQGKAVRVQFILPIKFRLE